MDNFAESGQQPSKKDLEQYLHSALEHTIVAGRSIKDFNEFVVDRLGDTAIPNIRKFLQDVRYDAVEVKGLTEAVQAKLFGHQVSESEREQMLREAAYFYWLKGSVSPKSDLENWLQAEKELDAYLDKQMGLIKRGKKSISQIKNELSKELKDIREEYKNWLRQKYKDAA